MKIERTITLGNLLGMLPLLAALIGWAATVNSGQRDLQDTRQKVAAHGDQLTDLTGRVTTLERLSESWQRDIVRRLERIEDKLDKRGAQ